MKKILITILSVIMAMTLVACGEKKEEVKSNNSLNKEQEVKKEEQIDLSKLELNQENVEKSLTNLLAKSKVKIKSVNVNDKDINIQLFQEPEDEKQFLVHSSNYFTDIVIDLFKNKNVENVEFIVDSKFNNDQSEKVEARAIDYKINRDKYKEINWEDVKLKIYSEPKILYDLLESASIHPSIINNIK
ncbi:TPA: hypothetical protein ACX96Z_001978 [Clostridium sporogenes]